MRALTRVWKRPVAWINENADELATTDAVKDDAEMAEQVAKDALDTRTKVAAAIRHAATFDDEVGELVDVEYVSEEDKQEPKWQFGLKEAEGRITCGLGTLHTRAPGVCHGLK